MRTEIIKFGEHEKHAYVIKEISSDTLAEIVEDSADDNGDYDENRFYTLYLIESCYIYDGKKKMFQDGDYDFIYGAFNLGVLGEYMKVIDKLSSEENENEQK